MARTAKEIIIDQTLCKRCGICVRGCPKSVYTVGKDGFVCPAGLEYCIACQLCVYRCPDLAITVEVE